MLLGSSAVIEDIRALQKAGLASLAFFYCDFREDQKRDRRGLLSSLLIQLGKQSVAYSDKLFSFYEAHHCGSQHASDNELLGCLKDMLNHPGQPTVHIIIDALDECPKTADLSHPREKVLKLVKELVDLRIPNLRICVTSRPEADIIAALGHLAYYSVSLEDEGGQVKDIVRYVENFVNTDSEMQEWKNTDKQLVIDVLSKKAGGMSVIHVPLLLISLIHMSNVGSVGSPVSSTISAGVFHEQKIFGVLWMNYQRRWMRPTPALWKELTRKSGNMRTFFFSVSQWLPVHFVSTSSHNFSRSSLRPNRHPHFWPTGVQKTRHALCYPCAPVCLPLSSSRMATKLCNLHIFQCRST